MIGYSSSSSDNTNPEEICPKSYCLCPPFEILRKPLRHQRTPSAHVATPHLKTTTLIATIFLQNARSSCSYRSYTGLQCFRW